MNNFFGGGFESRRSDVSRDRRSPEEKMDFETRKEQMIALAEKEGCLSHILILLQLVDVQAGFSDEGALFDYDERDKHRHVVRGGGVSEPENQMMTFRKYAMSQSDWLRSLYAFMEAIRTDENTPGLLEIINTQQDEWVQFERWCQGKFLNATALLQVKKALQKDQRINWADLQTFPIEKIRRVILEAHKDKLFAETEELGTYVPAPLDGFSSPPQEQAVPSKHSALSDSSGCGLFVATYLEPVLKEQIGEHGSGGGTNSRIKKFFAHGVHRVFAEEVRAVAPQFFENYEEDKGDIFFDPYKQEVLKQANFTIRGWGVAGLDNGRSDTSPAKGVDGINKLVDGALIGGRWHPDFHLKNQRMLQNSDGLYHRSRGRLAQEDINNFNLTQWYKDKLRELGGISTTTEAELYSKKLTLGLENFTNPKTAKELEESYPEKIQIGKQNFNVMYTWNPEKNKHSATIIFSAAEDGERARSIVQLKESDVPVLGTNEFPVKLSFRVVTPQAYYRLPEEKDYPCKEFDVFEDMIDYFDKARLAYSWRTVDYPGKVETTTPRGGVYYKLVEFSAEKDFPNTEGIISKGELNPFTKSRDGEPIYPYPAVAFDEYHQNFGILIFRSKEEATQTEELARDAWRRKKRVQELRNKILERRKSEAKKKD